MLYSTNIDDEKQADEIDGFERENDGEEMDRVIDKSHEESDESKINESENEEQNKRICSNEQYYSISDKTICCCCKRE